MGGKVKVVELPGRVGMALHCNCLNLLMVGLNGFIYLTNGGCICLQGGRFFLGGPPNLKTDVFREISGPRLKRTNRPLSERKLKVVHKLGVPCEKDLRGKHGRRWSWPPFW